MLALYSLCIVVLTWPNFRASGGILLTDLKHCMHFWGGAGWLEKYELKFLQIEWMYRNLPKSWTEQHGSYCCIYLRVAISCLPLALQNGIPDHRNFGWIKPVWSRFLRGNSRSRECRAAECPLVGTPGKCSGSLSAFPGTRERSEVLGPAAAFFDKFYLRK